MESFNFVRAAFLSDGPARGCAFTKKYIRAFQICKDKIKYYLLKQVLVLTGRRQTGYYRVISLDIWTAVKEQSLSIFSERTRTAALWVWPGQSIGLKVGQWSESEAEVHWTVRPFMLNHWFKLNFNRMPWSWTPSWRLKIASSSETPIKVKQVCSLLTKTICKFHMHFLHQIVWYKVKIESLESSKHSIWNHILFFLTNNNIISLLTILY